MVTSNQEIEIQVNGLGSGDATVAVDYKLLEPDTYSDIYIDVRVHSAYVDCVLYIYDESTDEEKELKIKVILDKIKPIKGKFSQLVRVKSVFIDSYELSNGILTAKAGSYRLEAM